MTKRERKKAAYCSFTRSIVRSNVSATIDDRDDSLTRWIAVLSSSYRGEWNTIYSDVSRSSYSEHLLMTPPDRSEDRLGYSERQCPSIDCQWCRKAFEHRHRIPDRWEKVAMLPWAEVDMLVPCHYAREGLGGIRPIRVDRDQLNS